MTINLSRLLAVVAAFFSIWTGLINTTATADQGRPDYCASHPTLQTAAHARERANKGWDAKHLKTREGAIERVRIQSHCAPTKSGRRHVKQAIDHARHKYKKAVQLAKYTPYDCGSNGNWAIPCYIVYRESHYQWGAYNSSSGARGPYQFLGWPVPWPVTSKADKLAHHKMAYKLWDGGAGCSHWSC